MSNFNEAEHPRAGDGKFTDKPQSAPEVRLGVRQVDYEQLPSFQAINDALVERLDTGHSDSDPLALLSEVTEAEIAARQHPGVPGTFLSVYMQHSGYDEPDVAFTQGSNVVEYRRQVLADYISDCEQLIAAGVPVPGNFKQLMEPWID